MHINLKFLFIFTSFLFGHSGISKILSFSISNFLSSKAFNLSVIVAGASSISSKIQHFPFIIARVKNPSSHFINWREFSLEDEFKEGYWFPIKSEHLRSSVHSQ